MAAAIGDYAVIGDGRSCALVSRSGSIEWLCWPRFDSPSLFAAVMDEDGGAWRVSPAGEFSVSRRYAGESNVLVTGFAAGAFSVSLVDCMAVGSESDKRVLSRPDHELIRIVRCERGEGEIEFSFSPRPYYGRRFRLQGEREGARCALPDGLLTLLSEFPLSFDGYSAFSRVRMRAGQSARFSLTFNSQAPAVVPPVGDWSEETVGRSIRWWEGWAGKCRYAGKYRGSVVRSALTLKLLGFSPSGSFVASPTTSLPEWPGGGLNWDYRFCWLRDSSLTVNALVSLGYRDEAQAYVSWLLHSTRLSLPRLGVLYDVYGRKPPGERIVPFGGFGGSRPVRAGNAAMDQLQLDVYGEVTDAAFVLLGGAGRLDRETRRMLSLFGDFVRDHWRQPNAGIWEIRETQKRYTHSLALCWACLDRLRELNRRGLLPGAGVAGYEAAMDGIRAFIERRCWDPAQGSFVSAEGSGEVDASLLMLPFYGFVPPQDPRMRATYRRIRERLGAGEGLLYRNRYFTEGAFAVCSCWAAQFLAEGGGTLEEATALFNTFLGYANDVGLFAEEIDPASGAALGNFPLAFTHLGVINAALAIEARERAR